MHPAYSVIVFTTASGAGYGLLALLGLFAAAGALPADTGLGIVALGLALGLIAGGLLSSLGHLGRPERAWRAMSQWRSSWLAREGVLALLTFAPAGLFAIGWVFLNDTGGVFAGLGVASAVLAGITVWCTSMIYASLKPIRQWHNVFVTPAYLVLGLMTGALLLVLLSRLFGVWQPAFGWLAVASVLAGWAVKAAYWHHIDTARPRSDLGTATGLGRLGPVSLLEMPHTEENFLMKEMGYRVARTHAAKLRRIAHLALFALPLLLSLLALITPPLLSGIAALLAVASAGAGVLTERWLFFAEARHTCMLYYGRAA
ncbi:dimethyl sulfoxide reductase anchor subunit family protein [Azospirillum halopraeferens]|uniref:dimethyl sulfoxide reductase anchor subunit family protein n=1 Tax=Azospirillum halopraeferens TaxID=34010 RepID=UPI00040F9696|nr:DmsC/YnfH family molybdoenzyme membrane anchor subunit [Azospirillum halopraeferens]